jgi:DNA helicase HerA-like ATPase
MTRVDQSEKDRRDFFLYVDEAQLVATRSMAELFPEARKFHLGLILAHQYLEQLDPTVRTAILGNVGTMVVFRIGARDADVLVEEFEPEFARADLANIPAHEMYLKMMIDGTTSRPFSARTLSPLPPRVSYRERIVEGSRNRYARPIAEVEAELWGRAERAS